MTDTTLITRARAFATERHAGQCRKYNGRLTGFFLEIRHFRE